MRIAILITNGENMQSSSLASTSRDIDSSAHDHKGLDLLRLGRQKIKVRIECLQLGIVRTNKVDAENLILNLPGGARESE